MSGEWGNTGGWSQARINKIPRYKMQIVELVREGLWLSEISDKLSINAGTIRGWRKDDPDFDAAFNEAWSAKMDGVEREAFRRAVHGVLEPVVSGGKLVMQQHTDPETGQVTTEPLMVRKFSDTLLMFVLKGHRRDVYGDRQEIEQTTKIDFVGIKEQLRRKVLGE